MDLMKSWWKKKLHPPQLFCDKMLKIPIVSIASPFLPTAVVEVEVYGSASDSVPSVL